MQLPKHVVIQPRRVLAQRPQGNCSTGTRMRFAVLSFASAADRPRACRRRRRIGLQRLKRSSCRQRDAGYAIAYSFRDRRTFVTSVQAFALFCSMHLCLPSPPAALRATSHSIMYYTQLMHEGHWQSGAVVIMTSTTYNAVKHAIRYIKYHARRALVHRDTSF